MINLDPEVKEELLSDIDKAQEKLLDVIELLENYVYMTDDQNAQAYIVDHLKIFASNDHGFLSKSDNIDTLRDRIKNGDDD